MAGLKPQKIKQVDVGNFGVRYNPDRKRTELDNKNDLIEALKKSRYYDAVMQMLDSPVKLWRGNKDNVKGSRISIFTPGIRKSANTNNLYTIMLSNIPSDLPPRNRSFICSTDYKKAHDYSDGPGATYMVVPLVDWSGNYIAMCPDADIWDTYRSQINHFMPGIWTLDVKGFNLAVQEAANLSAADLRDFDKTNNALKRLTYGAIDAELGGHMRRAMHDAAWRNVRDKNCYEDLINKVFQPNYYGRLVHSLRELKPKREVWIGAPCLMIDSLVVQLMKGLKALV